MARRLVLIEDNASNRCLATFLLEAAGWQFLQARDGPNGIALALQASPEVILLGGCRAWGRVRALVDSNANMILMSAPDGSVLSANPAACAAFGLSEEQVIAAGRDQLLEDSDPELEALMAERILRGRASGQITAIRANGSGAAPEVESGRRNWRGALAGSVSAASGV